MDPTLILLVVALGAFIVFQVFQGRKRKRETEERQTKFVPGVEIMTNYGLYGTILTLDEDTNVATIETTPGTVLMIHRQTILKVADYAVVPNAVDDAEALDEDSTDALVSGEPEFGERVEADATDTTSTDDAATGSTDPAKKSGE
ncbi:MAG: preprotein translocase subunit YajC [Burkholderiaceae bacterium]|nr:preprotein translocase subunit YajC [Microbacteriaceae bacterium]